jgi:hypothetical protein
MVIRQEPPEMPLICKATGCSLQLFAIEKKRFSTPGTTDMRLYERRATFQSDDYETICEIKRSLDDG